MLKPGTGVNMINAKYIRFPTAALPASGSRV